MHALCVVFQAYTIAIINYIFISLQLVCIGFDLLKLCACIRLPFLSQSFLVVFSSKILLLEQITLKKAAQCQVIDNQNDI